MKRAFPNNRLILTGKGSEIRAQLQKLLKEEQGPHLRLVYSKNANNSSSKNKGREFD